MRNKIKSITQMNMLAMVGYTIFVLILMFTATHLITKVVNQSFPVMSDLIERDDLLKKDSYSKLPKYIMENSEIIVFDKDDKMIYASDFQGDEEVKEIISDYIPYYNYQEYYNVLPGDEDSGYKWCIQKYIQDENSGEVILEGECFLDENNQIFAGDILREKARLTDEELQLMQGNYGEDKSIEKYQYVTNEGDERTLVFIFENISYEKYQEVEKSANRIWVYVFSLAVLVLIIASIVGKQLTKKSIQPIQKAIEAYEKMETYELDMESVPKEFEPIVTTFNQLVKSLDESQAEKQRIIADISHDLRTPLTVIKGYSQAFMDGMVKAEKQQSYMSVIHQKAELCTQLIDELVLYTKLEHPEYVLNIKEENIGEVCARYFADKYQELEISKIELEINIPEKNILVSCDKAMLSRLFDNIVSNVIKYGGEGVTLIMKIIELDKEIHIVMADTGRGIPEDIANNIFQPFVVGDETRKSGKGIGLGLSITKRIAELHGGTIELTRCPKEGIGTEFIIKLPL